jgi:hypothetical protein
MIQFFAKHVNQVTAFFDSWGRDHRAQIRSIPYAKFPVWNALPGGVCLFQDMESMEPDELSLAAKLADALRARPETYTVLNEPRHGCGRFNLLKLLEAEGINDFRCWRLNELNGNVKFPVFLRNELTHDGSVTPLIHSRDELDRVLAEPSLRKSSLRKHLIAIEFCDCSDGEIFRKYSVMNVNGTLIPRHILFSKKWVTKKADLVTEKTVAEELDFIKTFPYADQVSKAFRLARLDYGRIDFGIRRGRIQAWEINTNPVIVPPREEIDQRRLPAQAQAAAQITRAILALSNGHKNHGTHPFRTKSFFIAKVFQYARQRRRRLLESVKKRIG